MSRKTRHADNSKRQQPVQQQRAQAAANQVLAGKQAKGDKRPPRGATGQGPQGNND